MEHQTASGPPITRTARQLGVSTYPTLLFVDGPKVQSLPATGTALEVLNERLDALLA